MKSALFASMLALAILSTGCSVNVIVAPNGTFAVDSLNTKQGTRTESGCIVGGEFNEQECYEITE